MHEERFWFEEPRDLVDKFRLWPSRGDSVDVKLNVLTRILIIIVVIAAILKWKYWQALFIVGLGAIILMHLAKQKEHHIENFNESMSNFKYYPKAEKVDISKFYTFCDGKYPPTAFADPDDEQTQRDAITMESDANQNVPEQKSIEIEARPEVSAMQAAVKKSKSRRTFKPSPKGHLTPSEHDRASNDALQKYAALINRNDMVGSQNIMF